MSTVFFAQCNFDGPEKSENLVMMACFGIQAHFSSALPASHVHQGINWSIFTWGGIFVSKYHENCSLH